MKLSKKQAARLGIFEESKAATKDRVKSQASPSLFEAQALTYPRLCDLQLALVINFGERQARQGTHRVVNGLQE